MEIPKGKQVEPSWVDYVLVAMLLGGDEYKEVRRDLTDAAAKTFNEKATELAEAIRDSRKK